MTAVLPSENDLNRKNDALQQLGSHLRSYEELQTAYTALIHAPDASSFAAEWEASLYEPIRNICKTAIASWSNPSESKLLYCAPGAHAPLLVPAGSEAHPPVLPGNATLAEHFGHIVLADIDQAGVRCALNEVSRIAPSAAVQAMQIDFTGGLGQQFAYALWSAIDESRTVDQVRERLRSSSSIVSAIFRSQHVSEARNSLRTNFQRIGLSVPFTLTVSEMVASFTGTPVWMAFRSALYSQFGGESVHALKLCLEAAAELLRLYNARFLTFHLDFLGELTAENGRMVLVFDTFKRYDDPGLASQSSFPPDDAAWTVIRRSSCEVILRRGLVWRDHSESFDVRVRNIPVCDFQAHRHDVEVFVLAPERRNPPRRFAGIEGNLQCK
jgi:hypothetical protein